MIISAKFSSACLACGGLVAAGERVAWTKGERGVRHAQCTDEGRAIAAGVAASRAESSVLDVPAPDGLAYKDYQRAGVAYMLERDGTLLADDMGLGKTVQFCGLMNADPSIQTALIICPKSLAQNWCRELRKWLVEPREVARINDGARGFVAAVVVATFEEAKSEKFRGTLEGRSWDVVGIDEIHRCKNKTRATTKAQRAKQVAKGEKVIKRVKVQRSDAARALLARGHRRIGMSGTPFENKPAELFPLLAMIDPETWDPGGKGWWRYANRYCAPTQRFAGRGKNGAPKFVKEFKGASNTVELQERLRATCMIRRRKADVLKELPPKVRTVVELEIVDREVQRFDRELAGGEDLATAAARLVAGEKVGFVGASRERIRLGLAKASEVASFVRELIEGGSGKVLIGAWHHEVMTAIGLELTDLGLVAIHGQQSERERQAAIDGFQNDPSIQVCIGQIDAAGVGLTLTASSTCVMAEEPWTPGQMNQFEDRLHRIGQINSVNVYHLVIQNSFEAHIVKLIVKKQAMADAVLDDLPPTPEPDAEAAAKAERRAKLDARAAKLTPADIARIHQCLQMLAGVCNHAATYDDRGFSKTDADLGHDLAKRPELTPRQAVMGLRLCHKYRRQLEGMGVDQIIERTGGT